MGVPGFFAWLMKRYNKQTSFVFSKDTNHDPDEKINNINSIDELLIDANCLIHPQCQKVIAENKKWKDSAVLEDLMLKEITDYIYKLIMFVKPKTTVHLSIDGVAPEAKLKQQRLRRFKTIKDKVLFDNIKRKYKKDIDSSWNNAAITPGTQFMHKLTKHIVKFINTTTFYPGLTLIFSSANSPGEGEHKLLQYIRRKNDDNKTKYIIYGLDADLIFLALSTQRDNMYLLRETNEFTKDKISNEEFCFVSIDIMKKCICDEIISRLTDKQDKPDKPDISYNQNEMNGFINDFIFICYFLGNDFLPHVPSLDINNRSDNGLDILLATYITVFKESKTNIVIIDRTGAKMKIKLNELFLIPFFESLSLKENDHFICYHENKNKKRYIPHTDDKYEFEMAKIEHLHFAIDDPIKLGSDTPDNWKFRYYAHHFKSTINQPQFIEHIVYEYLQGLLWIAYYYFDDCPSWSWHYGFNHAPFISDLSNYINCKQNIVQITNINFTKDTPICPFEQLMSVLPPQSSFLLPVKLQILMKNESSPIIHLYPIDFELDMLYKHKYWQCIPLLPPLDIATIKKHVMKIQFSGDDVERNIFCDNLVFTK
ncbi:MAG: putative 5'-3' exonuclease, partial [Faunusvirus sp.]|jgi:5'-3' exonuclease